jgi:hypothetical protein
LWSGSWTGWDEIWPILARLIAKLEQRKITHGKDSKIERGVQAFKVVVVKKMVSDSSCSLKQRRVREFVKGFAGLERFPESD